MCVLILLLIKRITDLQLFDIVCVLILLGSSAILRAIRPGFIYYWLKVGLALVCGVCDCLCVCMSVCRHL